MNINLFPYEATDATERLGMAIYHVPDDIQVFAETDAAEHAVMVTWVYPSGLVEQWEKRAVIPQPGERSTFEDYCQRVAGQIANRHEART